MRRPFRQTLLVLCGAGVVACGVYLMDDPSGCALLSAIPYCNEYAAELHRIKLEFGGLFIPVWRWIDGFVRAHSSLFAGGYALIALYLFTQARYWKGGWKALYFVGVATGIAGVVLFGGLWVATACHEIHNPGGEGLLVPLHGAPGLGFLRSMAGLCYAILGIVLGLGFWIAAPLYVLFCGFCILFFLPSAAWTLLRLTVRAPFLLWHYLHYLFVPHPAERVIMRYEKMKMKMKRGVKIDPAQFGKTLGSAMYNRREGVPAWWKSENWRRRLEALRGRMKVEKDIVDDAIDDLRERNKRQR